MTTGQLLVHIHVCYHRRHHCKWHLATGLLSQNRLRSDSSFFTTWWYYVNMLLHVACIINGHCHCQLSLSISFSEQNLWSSLTYFNKPLSKHDLSERFTFWRASTVHKFSVKPTWMRLVCVGQCMLIIFSRWNHNSQYWWNFPRFYPRTCK